MIEKLKNLKRTPFGQSVLYGIVSLAAGAVDFGAYSLFFYVVLRDFQNVPVHWWIINYSRHQGGAAALAATAAAYFMAQTANFFLQRRFTFGTDKSVISSGAAYLIMIVWIWFLQMYLGGVFLRIFVPALGQTLANVASRVACNTVGLAIQFPLSKYVIMAPKKA